jgi:hypothetical protein
MMTNAIVFGLAFQTWYMCLRVAYVTEMSPTKVSAQHLICARTISPFTIPFRACQNITLLPAHGQETQSADLIPRVRAGGDRPRDLGRLLHHVLHRARLHGDPRSASIAPTPMDEPRRPHTRGSQQHSSPWPIPAHTGPLYIPCILARCTPLPLVPPSPSPASPSPLPRVSPKYRLRTLHALSDPETKRTAAHARLGDSRPPETYLHQSCSASAPPNYVELRRI